MPFVSWTISEDDDSIRPSKLTSQEISKASKEFAATTAGDNFLTSRGFPDVPSAIQQTLLRAEINTPIKNLRKVLKIVLKTETPKRVSLSSFLEVLGYLKALTKVKFIDDDDDDEENEDDENRLNVHAQLGESTLIVDDEDRAFAKNQQQQETNNHQSPTSTNKSSSPSPSTKNNNKKKMFEKSAIDILRLQKVKDLALSKEEKDLDFSDEDEDEDYYEESTETNNNNETSPASLQQQGVTIGETTHLNRSSTTTEDTLNNTRSSVNHHNNNSNNNNLDEITTTAHSHHQRKNSITGGSLSRQNSQHNLFPMMMGSTSYDNVIDAYPHNNTSSYDENNHNNNNNLRFSMSQTDYNAIPNLDEDEDTFQVGSGGAGAVTNLRRKRRNSNGGGAGDASLPDSSSMSKFVTRKRVELFESSISYGDNNGGSRRGSAVGFGGGGHDGNGNNNSNQLFEKSVHQPRSRNKQFMFTDSFVGQIHENHGIGYVDRYKLRPGDFQSSVTQRKLKDVLVTHKQTVNRVKRDQYQMAIHGMGGNLMDERRPFKTHRTTFSDYKFDPPLDHEPTDLPLFVHGRPVPKKIRDIEEQRRIQAVRRGEIEGAGRARLRCKTCTPDKKPNRFDVAAGRVSPTQLDIVSVQKKEAKEQSKRRLSVLGLQNDGSEIDISNSNNDYASSPAVLLNRNDSLDDGMDNMAHNNNSNSRNHQQRQQVSFVGSNGNNNMHQHNSSPAGGTSNNTVRQQLDFHSPTKMPPVMTKSLKAAAVAKVYGEKW